MISLMVIMKRILLITFDLLIIAYLIYPSQGVTISAKVNIFPTNRYGHDMVFDEINARVILFGGAVEVEGLSVSYSNETWSFNSTTKTWKLFHTITNPGLIAHHSMAYSSNHEKIVYFGGLTEAGDVVNETWIFDCDTNEWSNVFPILAPPARSDASLYFDTVNQKFVLFGGYRSNSDYYSNDLWTYDINTNTWTILNPLESPPESYGHRMVYDPIYRRGILFGGRAVGGVQNDLWVYYYQNNSWIRIDQEVKPITRYWHTMTYDSTDQQVIILGGRESEYVSTDILNDTWSFVPSQNTWMELQTTPVPQTSSASLVYDSVNNLVILFGGVSSISPNILMQGTWIFDFQHMEWLNITSTRTINYFPDFSILFFIGLYIIKKTRLSNIVDKKCKKGF